MKNAILIYVLWVANGTYYGLNCCFSATKKMDVLWYQKIKIAGSGVIGCMKACESCQMGNMGKYDNKHSFAIKNVY